MDILTIILLILAILALGGWGYGNYATRPVSGTVVQTDAGPATGGLTLLGIIGLILMVAFVVLLLTGWRFGLDVAAPGTPLR